MKEAQFYEKEGNLVKCKLCNHGCIIKEGSVGVCKVRKNISGKLYSLVYGKVIAWHVDPIEKKPLYHFYPGSKVFSIGTMGCNFRCLFCQNAEISQVKGEIQGEELKPEEIVRLAKQEDCESIAYTYTEPTIFYEYAYDTSILAHKEGIKNVFVSNGYMSKEALKKISPHLDAINIDLKSFSEKFYQKNCGAKLKPVLDNIKLAKELGIWTEVTTLLIPGQNDSPEELRELAKFLASVDPRMPWHISRFYPTYKMQDIEATPTEKIHEAIRIGKKEGLKYVYSGNIGWDEYENTYCENCGGKIIGRQGYKIENKLEKNKCPTCGTKIPIIN